MPLTRLKQTGFIVTIGLIAGAVIIVLTGFLSAYLSVIPLLGAVYAAYVNQLNFRSQIHEVVEKLESKTIEAQVALKNIRRKQIAMESLANLLPASIAFLSADRKFQYVNITCQKWFGSSESHMIGQHLMKVIGNQCYEEFELIFEDAQKNKQPITFSKNFTSTDGLVRCGRITMTPVEGQGCLLFIEDVTEIKEKESDMKKMNLELESQIEEKNKFKERLLETNKELQQFASVASHDMKEPLRTISSFSNLLARRIPDDKHSKEFLEFISDSAKRMTQLLEDLINYARTGLDQQPRQEVKLSDVVLTVRNNLYTKIQDTEAEIYVENLPTLNAHFTALTQIFQNIISNGVKFQREDNNPVIRIGATQTENTCTVTLSDNGIGMEQQYLDQIFEPFRRLHSRAEYEGSGIGLATCKKIMDEYHGELRVESEVGVGTTFILTFPIGMIVQNDNQPSEIAA